MRQLGFILVFAALGVGTAFAQTTTTITITPSGGNLTTGMVGTPYYFQFMGSGGTGSYTWYVYMDSVRPQSPAFSPRGSAPAGGLPPGLSLSPSTGVISGTPTTAGSYTFTIIVTDTASDYGSGTFTIYITPCAPTFVNTSPLPTAEVGINYSQQFSVTGCPGNQYDFVQSGNFPNGLTLSMSGVLSGQATTAGTYSNMVIAVVDQNGAVVQEGTFSLTVEPAPSISNKSLPNGLVGVAYGPVQLAVSGGVPPYRFGYQGLPPGLVLLSNGLLQGTPTTTGAFSPTFTATDSNNVSTAPATLPITVTTANPFLQVSPTSLTFSALVGGNAPPAQAVSITPSATAPASPTYTIQLDSGQTGTAAPSWLTVTPTSGTAPATLIVSADQTTMATGANVGRIRVFDSNNLETDVAVTLNVTAGTALLEVAPNILHFSARQDAPGTLQQDLVITSGGGGGSLGFSTSVVNGSSWITGVTPSSGQTTRNTPVLLQVQVNTQGLAVGAYNDVIQVSSSAGNVSVPVALFVSAAGSVIGVDVTGLRFQARQGGGFSNAQTVEVLNLGDPSSTVNWTASLLTGSNWLSLVTSSGTATATTPGLLKLTPNSSATNLTAPAYALVLISDAHSLNSPQYVVAVLDLENSSTLPLPDPSPAGLFFSAIAGGSQPAAQHVSVNTSSATAVAFQAATSTTVGGTWLTVGPASGTSTGATPGTLTVSASTAGLTAGIYTGLVNISMSGAVRGVNVTLVVEPSTGSVSSVRPSSPVSSGPETTDAAGCTASQLALTENSLANSFSIPAGWPATLIAQLNDNCGAPVTNGSVVASFSNGDAALTLRGDGLGNYSATWQPSNVTSQMVINLNASSGSLTPATAKLVGGVNPNTAPVLAPGGTLNNLNPVVGAPLAPGTVAQVYGSSLASNTTTPSTIPLQGLVNGTQMLIGGLSAPFYFLSSGQLNVELPFELAPNQQYQAVVIANNALTLPDTITFVPQQPGVAATSDGHAIAQDNSTYALVGSSANAANPGEYVIIYLVGMGATNPSVSSGAASPSFPLANAVVQPTVTVGGQNATVYFAGLTPGAVGLYQITFQIPTSTSPGNQPLVVTQGGVAANTTMLNIAQ